MKSVFWSTCKWNPWNPSHFPQQVERREMTKPLGGNDSTRKWMEKETFLGRQFRSPPPFTTYCLLEYYATMLLPGVSWRREKTRKYRPWINILGSKLCPTTTGPGSVPIGSVPITGARVAQNATWINPLCLWLVSCHHLFVITIVYYTMLSK